MLEHAHDRRDQETIARPIAVELAKHLCPVWYDEFSLKLGDSLRESIERGLKECKKCVLVLSANFLSNSGWTKAEFNAVFTREILERTALVLPVWCDVNRQAIYQYAPILLDRVAISWDRGLEEVVRAILRAVL